MEKERKSKQCQINATRKWEKENGIYNRTIVIREDELPKEKWNEVKDVLQNRYNTSISNFVVQNLLKILD